MADGEEQFSLCWNTFNSNLSAGFQESLCREDFVDVTLAAEGQVVKAHRLVLSVCSPYFRKMLTQIPAQQHAFVFLKDVSHTALKDLIQFMYCGQVNVRQEALHDFISTAEALQIRGLTDVSQGLTDPNDSTSHFPSKPATPTPVQPIQFPHGKQACALRNDSLQNEQIPITGDTISDPQNVDTLLQKSQSHGEYSLNITETAPRVTQSKRPSHRNSDNKFQIKRSKSTIEPIVPNTVIVPEIDSVNEISQQQNDSKSLITPQQHERQCKQETDDAELIRYDESYFTDTEEARNANSGGVSNNFDRNLNASLKAIVKQQFLNYSYAEEDQRNNDMQGDCYGVIYTTSRRGTQLVLHNENTYTPNEKSRPGQKSRDWKCSMYYKAKCPARLVTVMSSVGEKIRVTCNIHTHAPMIKDSKK